MHKHQSVYTAPVQTESGNNFNTPKPNMNVGEAANYLGIGVRTLRELIAKGEIRHVRIGRRVIVRSSDCDAFLEFHTV